MSRKSPTKTLSAAVSRRRSGSRFTDRQRRLKFEHLEPRQMLAGAQPAGGQFLISNTASVTAGTPPKVAADSNGDYVVVWTGHEIMAQRYSAAGAAEGSNFVVNTNTTGADSGAVVAMDSAGDFVVAWSGSGAGGNGTYAQRYNSSGVAQGANFLVAAGEADPAVAMDSAGDFVVAMFGTDGSSGGIFAQRYNAAGAAQGGLFQVNTYTMNDQETPTVAMDSAGDFVIVWEGYNERGSGPQDYDVFAQRYSAAGAAEGAEFRVNTLLPPTGKKDSQQNPSVAMDSAGDFVVAWEATYIDGSQFGIVAQRYDSSGALQGSEFQVNTFTSNQQEFAAVAMDSTGDFTITWSSGYFQQPTQDGSGYGIYAQSYGSTGAPVGGEFQVETYTTHNQKFSAIAMDASGDFDIVWNSYGYNGNQYGEYGQRYGAPLTGNTVTITGDSSHNNVTITFTSATDFNVTINGGSPTAYSTTTTSKLVYDGPSSFSKVVFNDPFNTYSATQSFTSTDVLAKKFEFDANSVANLFIYAGANTSSATVNVGNTAGSSNFYVESVSGGYSYIADPGTQTYSELSGFPVQTVTGSGGSTYSYVYGNSHDAMALDPSGSTLTVGANSISLANFPQLYYVGAADGTDTVTLDSHGGTLVATPGFTYADASISGVTYLAAALYTQNVTATAAGSADTADFYSYPGNAFTATVSESDLSGSTANVQGATIHFKVKADSYQSVTVFESGSGSDSASLTSPGHADFLRTPTASVFMAGGVTITINTFYVSSGQTLAVSNEITVTGAHDGTDAATLYDSPAANALSASGSTATLNSSLGTVTVNDFGGVTAVQQNGDSDTIHQGAIDFALTTTGNWVSD